MAVIELKNINKSYGKHKILQDFSLEIKEGEMVAITGPSGFGKSTILNILGFLDKFESGTYIFDGHANVKPNSRKSEKILRRCINYLFQNFALIDEDSVEDNLKIALEYVKAKNSKKKELIAEALNKVGLCGYEKKKIYELSGGEQQRVAIARCMLKPAKLILADEPTGSLDPKNVDLVLSLLKLLNKEGRTVVIVTHDQKVAESCDRIINIADKKVI